MSLPPGAVAVLAAIATGLVLVAIGLPVVGAIWLAVAFAVFAWRMLPGRQALAHWLEAPDKRALPEASGRWLPIFERLARYVREAGSERVMASAEIDRLHGAVDLLPDALIVLDTRNDVQWLNRAATELLGAMIVHRPVGHFIREPEFHRLLAAGDMRAAIPLPLARQPGRMFAMRLVSTPDGWRLLIMRDVTQQHRVEAMRRDFVANVSHEIRTPLTVISGFIDTLIELDPPREQALQFLRSARKQSATMERLLVDLLTLSSLESAAAADADAFELRPLLEAQVADARALSAGRHRIVLEADADVRLTGVASEIETAMRNLLTNAIRYTPDQGSITVRLALDPQTGSARLSVADSGIGIPAEHLPRLTERFYRVDRGRSRDSGGTGLGLAIVKHVAQRHQAELEIDSTPGCGSCFALVFPPRHVSVAATEHGALISPLPAPAASGTP